MATDSDTATSKPANVVLDISSFGWYPVFMKLCSVFGEEGHKIRIVGGAVRDILLETKPKDIDLCTTADPTNMLEILKKHNIITRETGIQHGTVTVHKKGHNFEMTSLRRDEIRGGVKECKYGTSFEEDSRRRDLTVNAMSVDEEGNLYDYFEGREHLEKRQLRFTHDPTTRILEDPLRILRYFRFSCTCDIFSAANCPKEYLDIFCERRSSLADQSVVKGERIWKEMERILASPRCCEVLQLMEECRVLRSMGFPFPNKPYDEIIDPAVEAKGVTKETRAAVVLGVLFKGKQEKLEQIFYRWRVANRVKDVARTAAEITGINAEDVSKVKIYLYKLTPSTMFGEEKDVRIHALKTDKTHSLPETLVKELEEFERPTFLFSKDHFAKVPKFKSKQKDATDAIKEKWINSCFTMKESEMVSMIQEMADQQELLRANKS